MKTNIINLKSLRENIAAYASRVARGEEFVVMRRSKALFKISPVDAWGDDGVWEAVMDFREVSKSGVRAHDVLKTLQKIDG